MLAYEDVLQIIVQELDLNKETIVDSIYDFLTCYVSLLEEQLVEDEDTMQTAMKLYQNYASATHLIYANAHQNTNRQKQIELREAVTVLQELTPSQRDHFTKFYAKKSKIYRINCIVRMPKFRTLSLHNGNPVWSVWSASATVTGSAIA